MIHRPCCSPSPGTQRPPLRKAHPPQIVLSALHGCCDCLQLSKSSGRRINVRACQGCLEQNLGTDSWCARGDQDVGKTRCQHVCRPDGVAVILNGSGIGLQEFIHYIHIHCQITRTEKFRVCYVSAGDSTTGSLVRTSPQSRNSGIWSSGTKEGSYSEIDLSIILHDSL